MSYGIKLGYVERSDPQYYVDTTDGTIWQPDVYAIARGVAEGVGVSAVFDLGCGACDKHDVLAGLEVWGFDHGKNLDLARAAFARRGWPPNRVVDIDLDCDALPAWPAPGAPHFSWSVIVAADIIEHLRDPRYLLSACWASRAFVISTPDRERTHGPGHMGPPPNRSHVREWTLAEFHDFLCADRTTRYGQASAVFRLNVFRIRSNDRNPAPNTIVAVGVRQ